MEEIRCVVIHPDFLARGRIVNWLLDRGIAALGAEDAREGLALAEAEGASIVVDYA